MKQTIRLALDEAIEALQKHNVPHAKLDAILLLEHVLEVDRVYILIHGDEVMSKTAYGLYKDMVTRRKKGKPLQYIIGHTEFMGLTFKVNEHVLIPRQDTEILVEEAMKCIDEHPITHILEVGTGSGCIPISICAKYSHIKVTTVDISQEALEVARENAKYHGVDDRITCIHSNVFEHINKDERYDLIISNPPYIKADDIAGLMREVRNHEPISALDGGTDGLDFYRRISQDSIEIASDECYIFYEVGHNQSIEVKEILENVGYKDVGIIKDLAGINRVVTGVRYT